MFNRPLSTLQIKVSKEFFDIPVLVCYSPPNSILTPIPLHLIVSTVFLFHSINLIINYSLLPKSIDHYVILPIHFTISLPTSFSLVPLTHSMSLFLSLISPHYSHWSFPYSLIAHSYFDNSYFIRLTPHFPLSIIQIHHISLLISLYLLSPSYRNNLVHLRFVLLSFLFLLTLLLFLTPMSLKYYWTCYTLLLPLFFPNLLIPNHKLFITG